MKSSWAGISKMISTGFRHWRIATIIYVFQLMLALLLGAQVYHVLESSIGQSLSIQKLLLGYDHTVWTDFLKVHGASVSPLLGQLRWLILLYFVFSVFLEAGAMYVIDGHQSVGNRVEEADTSSWALFWRGGARCFWSFMKISLVFLLFIGVFSAMVWLPILGKLNGWLEHAATEVPVIWGVIIMTFIYLLVLGLLYIWSVKSKLQLIKSNEQGTRQSIRKGGATFMFQPFWHLFLLLIYVFASIFLFWVATKVESWLAPMSMITVWLAVLVQQASAWLRLVFRMGFYNILS